MKVTGGWEPTCTQVLKSRYNRCMLNIALIGMRVLELMFFVGLVGSSIVVVISFIEDGKELFGKDE